MIEVVDVTKSFRAGTAQVHAVTDADIHVRPGEFVLILGRSGSGKTTLLGMLAGIVRPTSGSIRVKGRDLGTLSDDQISELRANEIGFIFQFSGLLPTVTVLENVLVPTLFCSNGAGARTRAMDLLRRVGMSDRSDVYPSTLSGGETKRVAIARALINKPSILIADEPTGDLDAEMEIEIMELFRQLNREGITIVMVTHNPELIPYADRTFMMNRGSLTEHRGSSPARSNEADSTQKGQQ